MSTLRLRVPHVPEFHGFVRAVSFIEAMFDVFAETQGMMRAAQKRYPFAEW